MGLTRQKQTMQMQSCSLFDAHEQDDMMTESQVYCVILALAHMKELDILMASTYEDQIYGS